MNETVDLRRLLDERGVEWNGESDKYGWSVTRWYGFENRKWVAESHESCGLLDLRGLTLFTAEQAIAATLGVGTCHADETETFECVCDGIGHYGKRLTVHVMECSVCGRTYEHINGDYEYCPRCGARIKVVEE